MQEKEETLNKIINKKFINHKVLYLPRRQIEKPYPLVELQKNFSLLEHYLKTGKLPDKHYNNNIILNY